MGWGTAISIGASLLSGSKGSSSSRAQERLALEELEFKREQAAFMNNLRTSAFDRSADAFSREDDLFNYVMGANRSNQSASRDFLNYSRNFVQQDRNYLAQEQEFEKYRVSQADREAAGERARQLQALIDDQNLAAEERQRALDELDYVREIAAGERDYDVKQYEADQMTAALEYQYRVREYENSVGIANDERQFEIDRQERILRQAGILSDDIDRTIRSFGPLEGPRRYGEDDVNRVTDDFYTGFLQDADRAADRLASVNEAGLIRGGVDNSTVGDVNRRQLLQEQLVPLYNTARTNARLEALGYVDGLQDNEIAGFNSEVTARAAAIDEQIRGRDALLGVMQNLRTPTSARITDYMNLGTGNVSPRAMTSAGSFRSPLQVGSQIVDRNISPGMLNQTALSTSRAGVTPAAATGQFQVQQPNFTTGGQLASVSLGGGGYDSDFASLAQGAGNAAADSTQNYLDAFNNFGKWLDS